MKQFIKHFCLINKLIMSKPFDFRIVETLIKSGGFSDTKLTFIMC
jgi:hypothetical protein